MLTLTQEFAFPFRLPGTIFTVEVRQCIYGFVLGYFYLTLSNIMVNLHRMLEALSLLLGAGVLLLLDIKFILVHDRQALHQ